MVQEFYILKCFSCNMFQVHIVKKSKKWSCKICNANQSILKVFGQGTAKDCRLHVQKLNALVQSGNLSNDLLTRDDRNTDNLHEQIEDNSEGEDSNVQISSSGFQNFSSEYENMQPSKRSKWEKFSELSENSINEFGGHRLKDDQERRSEKFQKSKESDKVQSDLESVDTNRLKLYNLNELANPGQYKPENVFSNTLTFPQKNEKLVEMERLGKFAKNEDASRLGQKNASLYSSIYKSENDILETLSSLRKNENLAEIRKAENIANFLQNEDTSRLRLKNVSSNSSPLEPESDFSETLNFLRRNEKLTAEMERSNITNCFQEDNASRLRLENVCSKFPEAVTSVVENWKTDHNLTKKVSISENVHSKETVIQFLSENDQQEIDSILDL